MQIHPATSSWQITAQLTELKSARWVWCLLAVIVVAVRHLSSDGAAPFSAKFGDTDDALRLLQIREFMIHGSWYDTRLAAIGAPDALQSHWSRLIDLPVAWLISTFAIFTSYASAELLAQIVWPLLLLFALSRFMVHEVEHRVMRSAGPQWGPQSGPRSGLPAGVVVLALLLLCPSGLFQFMPGRIDHHNVQIACAVAGILLMQRALGAPDQAWKLGSLAGAIMALGLVVGFEALPLLAVTLGTACLLACFHKTARDAAAAAVITLTIGLLIGFAATMHPSRWFAVECDALSPNLIALCGAGAVAAAVLITRLRDATHWVWLGGFGTSGLIGLGLYVAADPTCAGGAFSGMDPIVKTHWLAGVVEGKSLAQFALIQPSVTVGYIAIMTIALFVLVRQAWATRSVDDIFAAVATLLAGLYGFYYIKFMPYGALLSLVPLACWIARLPAIGEATADQVRMRAVIVCNQTLFVMLAGFAIGLFSNVEAGAKAKMSSSVAHCTAKSDIAMLSKLPPGLVVSDIDLGPYIALSTHHRAYAGPYHRIHTSLRDLLELLSSPVAEAGPKLAKMNADYLVLCAAANPSSGKQHNFSRHMRNGGTFAGLEPLSIGNTQGPLVVWKIKKP
jgi:hypothetical protein